MFEQDYIMRLIKEMVRAILKALFHIDTESPVDEVLKDAQKKETLGVLLDLVDAGRIDEAENRIYEMTFDGDDLENLKTALLFYAYLNEKTDAFLEEHDFSREEVKTGLEDVVSRYGLDSMAEMFLEE